MAAEAFVNYVLSQTGQQKMVHDPNDSDSYYTPLIAGITPLPSVKSAVSSFQALDPIWLVPTPPRSRAGSTAISSSSAVR